eukprot:TRINITY_DN42808_c0_g1_i1.p1 TRINITY_DN42808_c0_g1~~TRINITY_DN42808_c0_g1_i1.p1  ORF type:complete len:1057 (-),score=109.34 TRINITY_DN42808_c0_g1_i1:89-2800(-)
MVDQMTRGHQFLWQNFGEDAAPRGAWQIDPFGHSSAHAWLSAESGLHSLFWGRQDYQDFGVRKNESRLEWLWRSSSLGAKSQVFAGSLYGTGEGMYSTWVEFAENLGLKQIQDNPERQDYNVDSWVEAVINHAHAQAQHTRTQHQMWAVGSDFAHQNAQHVYSNLDRLIHYVNMNGTVNAFYSTPTVYTASKNAAGLTWEVRSDDTFPHADAAHRYWVGYYTSRPAFKKQVRSASAFLQAARQLELLTGVSSNAYPGARAPRVGGSWTDRLEGAIAVATHHDGVSGTSRQSVADDFSARIADGAREAEAGVGVALQHLLETGPFSHCNCNAGPMSCLNASTCPHSQAKRFSIVLWNQRAQQTGIVVRVPVVGVQSVTHNGREILSESRKLTAKELALPFLYLNTAGLCPRERLARRSELTNTATHMLTFVADTPSVGYSVYQVAGDSADSAVAKQQFRDEELSNSRPSSRVVSNGIYELTLNDTGITRVSNIRSGVSTTFQISWGWLNASIGGCTMHFGCDFIGSGAYRFRPNSSRFFPAGLESAVRVEEGPLMTEIVQSWGPWLSHTVRLIKDEPYIEVEWTVGPIPKGDSSEYPGAFGKEVIVRYSSGLASGGNFHTDANGREMTQRQRNRRPSSWPPLVVNEPIAGNYYPLTSIISLDDGVNEMAVLLDRSQGGSSISDGEIELMVHRRLQKDDELGVEEPLNETMCGCNDIGAPPGHTGAHGHEGDGGCECAGLTIRGRHWLLFDTRESVHALRRPLADTLNFAPIVAFGNVSDTGPSSLSHLASDLPPSLKLQTWTSAYAQHHGGKHLIRLAHMFAPGEHPDLSQPVTLDLRDIFPGLFAVEEMALTGALSRRALTKSQFTWNGEAPAAHAESGCRITIDPMETKTFLASFAGPLLTV